MQTPDNKPKFKYLVDETLVADILKYLGPKPYNEVYKIMDVMRTLKPYKPTKEEKKDE